MFTTFNVSNLSFFDIGEDSRMNFFQRRGNYLNLNMKKELARRIENPRVPADSIEKNFREESQSHKDFFPSLETPGPSTRVKTYLEPNSFPNSLLFSNPSQVQRQPKNNQDDL